MNRKQFIWPAAAILLGALVSINPFYRPDLTLQIGIAAWFADLGVVVLLSVNPATMRFGVLIAGLFLAVPCFVREIPLARAALMCLMAFPLLIAAIPFLSPPPATFRERMSYLFTWFGTREVKRRTRAFELKSLLHLIAATLVFSTAMVAVKAVSAADGWAVARLLSGGIMIMAAAEMITAGHNFTASFIGVTAPALMQSPFLSTSLGEFWTKRWNPAASSLVFRACLFRPLSRRGPVLALWAAFFASAVAHALLPYMAMGKLGISLLCGAFFLAQPPLIAAERWLQVRRWKSGAARVWTLAALTIASPLFVEPLLQLLEPSWGASNELLLPTLMVLGFVIGLNVFFLLGALAACPQVMPAGGTVSIRAAVPRR